MTVVWLIARSEIRHRWRSLLVLGLLVGLVGAVVASAMAGARRTESAYSRLLAQTRNHDASVEVSPEYFDLIAALPQVEAVAPASFMFVKPIGLESDDGFSALAGIDERFGDVTDRPLLRAGRRPSPASANEVLINSELADRLGVAVGDVLQLTSLAPDQLEPLIGGEDPGEPAGPRVVVDVVGVGLTTEDLANRSLMIFLTPTFYGAHRDDIAHFDDILQVVLDRGDADFAGFRDAVQHVVPATEGVIIDTPAETAAEIEDTTGVQATSLVAFAAAATIAGFVAIALALSRQIAAASTAQNGLRALGFSKRQRFATLFLPLLFVAVGGACLAAIGALLTSPITPTGFARRVEPDPGFAVDRLALVAGFLAIALAVSLCAALSSWLAVRRPAANATSANPTGRVLGALLRIGAPPAALVGVRMALESRRGPSATPVRPALAGAVAGVAGVVAALTFGAGLDWVLNEPAAYGWGWDVSARGPAAGDELEQVAAELAESREIEGVAALSVQPILLQGQPLQSYGVDPLKGTDFRTALEGRVPIGEDEVLLGSETLDRLNLEIGESLSASGLEGGAERTLTIVGRGVFPEFVHPAVPDSDTGAYNDFALLTQAAIEPFVEDAGGEFFSLLLIRWAPGVDVATAGSELSADGIPVEQPALPPNLANLRHIEAFPFFVAAFLVLLGAVALLHALVTSVQRRARELAVLKTLGFVRGQFRATFASQASTVAAVGLVIGLPAGVIIGRMTWAFVARGLGVDMFVPTPLLAIFLTIPTALVLANLAAAFVARSAARAPANRLLRRE